MCLHDAPLASRPPVGIELVEGILRVLLRMLLPGGVVHPDAVGGVIVFVLDGSEEVVHNVFLGPVAIEPHEETG